MSTVLRLGCSRVKEPPNSRRYSTRNERNYGREGMALLGAGMATVLPGDAIGLIGLVLLFASGDHNPLLRLAYIASAVGMVLPTVGSLRFIQGVVAGRAFRGDRPFDKGAPPGRNHSLPAAESQVARGVGRHGWGSRRFAPQSQGFSAFQCALLLQPGA